MEYILFPSTIHSSNMCSKKFDILKTSQTPWISKNIQESQYGNTYIIIIFLPTK